MFNICNKKNCTGCSACYSICPKNAITMEENEEGFVYPVIDTSLCVDCGLCQKVCPSLNYNFSNDKNPKCYAAMAKDEIRAISSSGGAFTVFANYILSNNGVICGAGYDENMNVEHIIIDNINDLKKLNGSKYVQSNINDCYKKIKEYLLKGRFVLFSGCPCQVTGLTNYLGKLYDNLLTLDLICHGVPSPLLFKKYLKEEYPNEKIIDINFRSKINGWNKGYNTIYTRTSKQEYINKDFEDIYFSAFGCNMSLRKSCYNCKYTKLPRTGDITIADFWGITKDCDDKKGTSLLLINNNNGFKYFNFIKKEFKLLKEKSVKLPINAQPNLRMPSREHPARDDFFRDLNNMSLKEAFKKNICSNKNIAILNFDWEQVNFGAVLTAFALNSYLNNNGYNARNIDYIPHFPWIEEEEENINFKLFKQKYIPNTIECKNLESLKLLNAYFKHFIVGSDQVWRYDFIKKDLDVYFLNFTNPDKNLISCAASFGSDININMSNIPHDLFKQYLSNFNTVTVREQNGLEYCNSLGINAIQVLDPVFLLSNEEWNNIINNSNNLTSTNDIVFYTINPNFKDEILDYIINNKTILNYNTYKNITYKISIENWLYQIKNSKLFITDSFHGVCFAIIFNKQFICINKNETAIIRIKNLLQKLSIKNRLFNSFSDIDIEQILNTQINYNIVNKNIANLTYQMQTILFNAIKYPHNNQEKKQSIKNKIFNIQLRIAKKYICNHYLKYIIYKIKYKIYKKTKYKVKMNNFYILYKTHKNIIKKRKNKIDK